MSIDLNRLHGMESAELRTLAIQMGLSPHHKLGKDKLVTLIIEKATATAKVETGQPIIKPQQPVHNNTPEDVEKAIAAIKARQPRFVSSYNLDDNTWLFQCLDSRGLVGCEESGNLAIPLRLIVRQANSVSLGKRQLIGLNDHFDRTTAGGNSAYTNSVLAG